MYRDETNNDSLRQNEDGRVEKEGMIDSDDNGKYKSNLFTNVSYFNIMV